MDISTKYFSNHLVCTIDGTCYKNKDAFRSGNGICYIAEYDIREKQNNENCTLLGYKRRDFLNLCNGNQELAESLFDSLTWQHPETLLDEWECYGMIEDYLDENGRSDPLFRLGG